jgi:hypothetical protein
MYDNDPEGVLRECIYFVGGLSLVSFALTRLVFST